MRPALAIAIAIAVSACSASADESTPSVGETTASTRPTASPPASSTLRPSTPPPSATAGAEPAIGDGFTISAATAEAADACFAAWHSIRTAAIAAFSYDPADVEAIVALCAQADELLDTDNRGAPEGALPAHQLSAVIGQVLLASTGEMLLERERCATATSCRLDGGDPAQFLALPRVELEAFSGEPERAPTVEAIEGLRIH
jgi:hypothetical protein